MPACTFLFCTAPAVTYAHPTVLLLWRAVWVVAAGALGLLLAWGGICLILREHLNPRWATWRELMPRLVVAALAASTSLWWGSLLIDLNNAIIDYFRTAVLSDGSYLFFWNISLWGQLLSQQPWETVALYLALLVAMLFYGFFFILLAIQLFIRLALIDALLVLSPIGLVLWVLPQTANWSAWWLRLFMVTVFQQAVQIVVLTLGSLFLLGVQQPASASQVLLAMPVGIAVLYLTTKVPALLERATGVGVFEGWGRTLTMALMVSRTFRLSGGGRASAGGAAVGGGNDGGPSSGPGGFPAPGGPQGAPSLALTPSLAEPPRATALAASMRLALPAGGAEGGSAVELPALPPGSTGALADESRMTRVLLDLSHTQHQQRREGDTQ